jgi:phosphopantetheine adenylyltransferase
MLRLCSGSPVNDNVAQLLASLRGGAEQQTVYLDCTPHCCSRQEIIHHITALYSAAVESNVATQLDIVPCFRRSDNHFALFLADDVRNLRPCFTYAACGGTFDRLHSGHKLLLTTSALCATAKLRIGVTGPELLKRKKFAALLQSFEERRRNVLEFISKIRSDLHFEIAEIVDVTGGTDTIAEVEALIASPETRSSIEVINRARSHNGLRPLQLVEFGFVGGDKPSVSSTTLREREQQKMS